MKAVEVPSRARTPLSIRVNAAERRLLESAAARQPQYVAVYIREVALVAARRALSSNGSDRPTPELVTR